MTKTKKPKVVYKTRNGETKISFGSMKLQKELNAKIFQAAKPIRDFLDQNRAAANGDYWTLQTKLTELQDLAGWSYKQKKVTMSNQHHG